jgi:hypothetical protein
MPYESRAEVERERDELRDALEGILDKVTDALGVEDGDADDDDGGIEESEETDGDD